MAVTSKRHDVIQLLIEHGADLELAVADGWTALFAAVKVIDTSAAKLLLKHGANVNHREKKYGLTALFMAIENKHKDMVELLILYGADVNVYAKRYRFSLGVGYSPLWAVLRSFNRPPASKSLWYGYTPRLDMESAKEDYADCVYILKLIVHRCDVFDFRNRQRLPSGGYLHPGVLLGTHCLADFNFDAQQLIASRYLLCHGATSRFSDFYRYLGDDSSREENFLKLLRLAGSEYDLNHVWHQSLFCLRKLNDKIQDSLFSQPLTLQEMSVMSIRHCIGCPKLWAKIDALPVPSMIKDFIKLKSYQSLE